jgi:chaperone modulatory protein CbpM
MTTEKLITIQTFCANYDIEFSFINSLSEFGLIEITTINKIKYLHQNKINEIEKMIRLHNELGVNMEGIDVIYNLTEKIKILQKEIDYLKNRILFFE